MLAIGSPNFQTRLVNADALTTIRIRFTVLRGTTRTARHYGFNLTNGMFAVTPEIETFVLTAKSVLDCELLDTQM